MEVFDGSSTVGCGSSFQVPSLSGTVTSQEQGSPVSPQVFSSVPAPRASGHGEFQKALKDPEFAKTVRGLNLCLKVRERERLRDSGVVDSCRVTNAGRRGRVPLLHHFLRSLLLYMRMPQPCTVRLCRGPPVTAWIIRGRTRLKYRVPWAQRGSKVGFPVRPKICSLSQRRRQG